MGTGDVKREIRLTDPFTKIFLYDNINIVLIQGTENRLEVEAGENLIDGISTKLENGELTITNENTCNFMRSYKIPITIYITYNSLTEFTHYGAGKVSNEDTLRQPFFEFIEWNGAGDFDLTVDIDTLKFGFHTGAGNADVRGTTKELSLYSAGNSIFRCKDLLAGTVYINQSSTGDFTVNVLNSLYVQIYNYGDVFYYGNPSYIEPQYNGDGELIHL